MPYDSENVFAKILRGEMPCHKVYENESTVAFMDIMPMSDGHVLVVPRSPAENIFDLDEEYLKEVTKTTKLLSHAIKKALDPSGLIVKQFNGSDAGQTVFHYHMHIIPVYNGAPNKNHGYEMEKPERLESIAQIIAAKL
ncbi:MAG: HIT family protein [Candidatus Thioglobus sp.]|jgi:histidine triad (HIT) family protein|nr:HIT family protein [Gammaproteobacteria bacterium]MDP6163058.1 HIT family protein [Candidatus Thioglobus sp.]MBQ09561.1 HIT family protein [Gammaproteobacteria bacterium]HJL80638.1 HIT family protein [Gammaproteobacteria bacterium]HJM08516.1 HIT family protein [Gammaproteobacteria bacterium]|tara:strand:+ start:3338 stop:3754 length:417 start_codon:yes stop_codon:yes gene_type:complete